MDGDGRLQCSRQTIDVVRAVISDGRARMMGDQEPTVSGHFTALLTRFVAMCLVIFIADELTAEPEVAVRSRRAAIMDAASVRRVPRKNKHK